MSFSLLNLPRLLLDWYIEYLWNHEYGSWVHSSAKSLRILAWLVVLPFAFFIMLDIASYIIARTLGVIDDTKASTSDNASVVEIYNNGRDPSTPSIVLQRDLSSVSSSPGDGGEEGGRSRNVLQQLSVFEGWNLKLSGVGVFSPAASRPSSPATERKRFPSVASQGESECEGDEEVEEEPEEVDEGRSLTIVDREPSWGSFSVDSANSFTMIDRDSGSEEPSSLRKRPMRDGILMTPVTV